jgi:hypothetical protein
MVARIFEVDGEFTAAGLQCINGQFVVFDGVTCHIEGVGCVDKNGLIFCVKFPAHIEPLGGFQPIFYWD